jgi:NtrC-family two-component system sensor histidine kinase KinB
MKIKTKLNLGLGLLFILILLLGAASLSYIVALKADTENILKANFQSLEYARNMMMALDSDDPAMLPYFDQQLRLQEDNLTETGESRATMELDRTFMEYSRDTANKKLIPLMRKEINTIMALNMEAVKRKSEKAKQAANRAIYWVAGSSLLCLIIALGLLVSMPASIANPIKELTKSIKQIAAKKYSERVSFEGHNEFGDLAKSFNSMAEKLEEYNNSNLAKLMMEKKRIETLINNMHDPVIGLDQNLKVIFANEMAIRIAGLQANDLIGHQAQDLAITNDLIRTLIQDVKTAGAASTASPKQIKIYADGKESYFENETVDIRVLPTGEQTKVLIGHVIILRNVTQYKELDVAKTNFIATVSHEFKTPISSIKFSIQLLENQQNGKLNEEQKELLDGIKEDAERLLSITSELLNITQVESGNVQLAITPNEPLDILEYAVNATRGVAEQKHIKLVLPAPEKWPKVLADHDKTAWVLTNLIANAIRYSYDNATVYLGIATENGKLTYSVRDTGQGIAPQYVSKVFERYYRVPGTKKEGTGLGLAISKEFMEAQGGTIRVESELGMGTTFFITLNCMV